MKQVLTCYIGSPLGLSKAVANPTHLLSLQFVEKVEDDNSDSSAILSDLAIQLKEYFKSERKEFDIPMEPLGTNFQKAVWKLLLDIEHGQTSSYQDLAIRYGELKSRRAIASANGANPIAILIPCHRVIGSDGILNGYAGGLWRKEFLLDLESGQQTLF